MTISTRDAVAAILSNEQQRDLWRHKAIALLELVGQEGVDLQVLARQCAEHAKKGSEF